MPATLPPAPDPRPLVRLPPAPLRRPVLTRRSSAALISDASVSLRSGLRRGPAVVEGWQPRVLGFPAYARLGMAHALPDVLVSGRMFDSLRHAASALPPGFDLVVLDGVRPLELQRELVAAFPAAAESGLVAAVSPDAPHVRGDAVDVTLLFEGSLLLPGSGFDEFSPSSAHPSADVSPEASAVRSALADLLSAAGLQPFRYEWWHFHLPPVRV